MKGSHLPLKAALLGGAIALSGLPSFAATADAEGVANLGEVVVTAQRRAQRLEDVPATISVISADTLQKSGITNTADLARVTPGLEMPYYGLFLQPAIRGVSSAGANLGDSANVAMYIDGVYMPQQQSTLIDLPDISQIEVLKGPQGALYGQNATGGAILVNSLSPSFDAKGKFSASYGNYSALLVRGYLTGPIGDKIAVSLGGGYQDRKGFLRQVTTGERDSGLNSKVIRGKVLFQPSDKAKITLGAYYSDREDSANNTPIPYANSSVGYAIIPTAPRVTPGSGKYAGPVGGFTANRGKGVNLRGEFDVGVGTVNSISAFSRNKSKYSVSLDGAVGLAFASTDDLHANYFTQEVNFISQKFGKVSFLLGAFYMSGEDVFDTSDFRTRVPALPPAPLGATTLLLHAGGRLEKDVKAVYADFTFDITDKLVVTAGGRYTRERQRGFSDFNGASPALVERSTGPETSSKFTPRITARYEVAPRANVYLSWGKGFKSSIINTADLNGNVVRPEVVTAYEGGFKGRVTDSLTVNLAAFYYNYNNMQVAAYQPPVYITQNAATSRIKGVDADFTWTATPNLTIRGGVALLDAKYRKFPAAQVFLVNGFGITQTTEDVSGKRLLRSPKFTANLAADYHVDTEMGRFAVSGSLHHNSGFNFDVGGYFPSGKYTTIDGEISFSPSSVRGLRLVAWGKNLTGEDYYLSYLPAAPFATGMAQSDPLTFGVRAEYEF